MTKKETCSEFAKPGKTLAIPSVAGQSVQQMGSKFSLSKRHETYTKEQTKTNLPKVYIIIMPKQRSQAWCCTTVIPAGGEQGQEDQELQTILKHRALSMMAWTLSQKKQTKTTLLPHLPPDPNRT